ncbi:hypothetical protein CC86DRAFT_430633 [Ophiobolus disseminans]|uniref:Rhodopsin domain-containing protein n=1 Tax=Ophiobolus disseminans TaxID=1469910 RepID=A0A6A7AEA1_9PLEO|nr:hypothetical protein CC86DRAFT_430633 [Ophiobolus disseminans]
MSFQLQLASQSWTFFARWRRVRSATQFAVDDWLMVSAVPLFYTGLIACLNIIAGGGGSNLFPPEQFASMSHEEIDERIKGSKIVIVSEQCMLNVIWTLKACMLFMFSRMITGTTYNKWIKFVAGWVVVGYVAVQIAFFTACRPFTGYWAVPPPNPQCTTLEHFAYVQATFNISSDLLIIALPIPMIYSLTLPLKQKLGLGILFSMGTFVIVAAILTKVFNLSDVYATTYMFWYTREASVAVYVANLPGIWPLLREHIRFLRDHTNSYITGASAKPPKYGYGSQYGNMSTSKGPRSRMRTDIDSDEIELGVGHSYATKSGARSVHGSEKKSTDERRGGFGATTERQSLESDERALRDVVGSWTQMGVVQVDTKVEIMRNSWDARRDEEMQGVQVSIQGPVDVEKRG